LGLHIPLAFDLKRTKSSLLYGPLATARGFRKNQKEKAGLDSPAFFGYEMVRLHHQR
jgi:hypothetical protein